MWRGFVVLAIIIIMALIKSCAEDMAKWIN